MSKTYSMQFGTGDPRTYTGLSPTMLIFVNVSSGATIAPPSITEALTGSGIYKFTWGTTTPIAFLADAATTSPGAQGRYVCGQIDPADRADEYGTTLVAIGTSTIAFGASTIAFGSTLIGFGTSTIAFGTTAIALGTTTVALGTTSVALGTSGVALGTTLIGYGVSNIALGTSSVAQGLTTLGYGVSIYALEQVIGASLAVMGNSLATIGSSLNVVLSGIGSTASSFGTSSADPVDLFGYLKRILENLEGDSQYIKSSGLWTILDRTSGTTFIQKTITNNATLVIKT